MKAVISTNEVARQWVNTVDYRRTPQQRETLFYDWLNEIRAKAWDEGVSQGVSAHCEQGCSAAYDRQFNPYRKGN